MISWKCLEHVCLLNKLSKLWHTSFAISKSVYQVFSLLHDLKTQHHLEIDFGRPNRSNVLWPGTFVSFDWLRSNFKWFWFEGYLHVTVKIMMIKQAVSFNGALSFFCTKVPVVVCLFVVYSKRSSFIPRLPGDKRKAIQQRLHCLGEVSCLNTQKLIIILVTKQKRHFMQYYLIGFYYWNDCLSVT